MRKNKKGVSGVVVVVIMIALVMAAAVIVWTVINRMIEEKTESTESCFGNFGKVTLNSQYTCYTEGSTNQFSITISDIDVDSVLVSVSAGGETKGFEITSDGSPIDNLANYGSGEEGMGVDTITLPSKNSGKTYHTDFSLLKADMIEIAPVIGGSQCGVSDSISDIEACSVYQLT